MNPFLWFAGWFPSRGVLFPDDGSWTMWLASPGATALLATCAVLAMTPLVIRAARYWEWVDYPNKARWHSRPVALMGGIGIVAALVLTLLLTGSGAAFSWPVWMGMGLIFFAGLVDDVWALRPEVKLVLQIISTTLLLYAGLAFWRGGPFWVSVPLTFLWVIGVTNAFNLIDGMDGLASGIAAIAASVLGGLAWMTGNVEIAMVAGAVAGATTGFLVFNFNPARIFMGDCGSMTLGYVLAVMAMSVQGSGGPVAATLAPVVVLAVPIFDTTFVTVTRILTGRSVSEGGVDHTHHRLAHLGMSERRAVLTLHGISLVFGACALLIYSSSAQLFLSVLLFVCVAVALFGIYLASADEYRTNLTDMRVRPPTRTEQFGALMQAVTGAGISWKSVMGMLTDLLLVGASFMLAHYLRFEAGLSPTHADLLMTVIPAVMAVKVVVFYVFHLYSGIWRYAGTPEILRLVLASTAASLVVATGIGSVYGIGVVSVSVLVIDWMITTGVIAGVRFGFRGLRQYFASMGQQGRRVVIVGTDESSLLALRHLRETPDIHRHVVGLIDQEGQHTGLRVQGVTVLGTVDHLPTLCAEHQIDEVVFSERTLSSEQQRALKHLCDGVGVICRHFHVQLRPVSEVWMAPGAGDGTQTPASISR